MSNTDLLHTHNWSNGQFRQFRQDGKTLTLRQCSLCRRDFAQGFGPKWQAAYVSVFKVDPLPKTVSDRWLQDPCPMRQIAEAKIEQFPSASECGRCSKGSSVSPLKMESAPNVWPFRLPIAWSGLVRRSPRWSAIPLDPGVITPIPSTLPPKSSKGDRVLTRRICIVVTLLLIPRQQ